MHGIAVVCQDPFFIVLLGAILDVSKGQPGDSESGKPRSFLGVTSSQRQTKKPEDSKKKGPRSAEVCSTSSALLRVENHAVHKTDSTRGGIVYFDSTGAKEPRNPKIIHHVVEW